MSIDVQWCLGVLFIVIVAVIWNFSSMLVQFVFSDLHFDEPFFLTYVANSIFAIYMPLWLVAARLGAVRNIPWAAQQHPIDSPSGTVQTAGSFSAGLLDDEEKPSAVDADPTSSTEGSPLAGDSEAEPSSLSHQQILKISLVMCPLWFSANCLYNYALSATSNTSSTIISTTSSLWAFILGVLCSKEVFSWQKLLGVLVCIGGATCVGWDDHDGPGELWGDLLALAGAATSGVYTIALAVLCPSDGAVSMALMFGYLGMLTAASMAPVLGILLGTHNADLSKLTLEIFAMLVAKGVFDNVLADYLWARAVMLTSPTVATVGLSLTIPLAFISDVFQSKFHGTGMTGLGAFLVILGFLMVNDAFSPILLRLQRAYTKPSMAVEATVPGC